MNHCNDINCPTCGETSERGRDGGNVMRSMAKLVPLGIAVWCAIILSVLRAAGVL